MKQYLYAGTRFCWLPLVFCFLSLKGYGQTCEVKNLVFEGAGIRGIAYAGVLEALEKQGKLSKVEKVGGTSAGAITALLVSLGYSARETADIISATRFNRFNDGRFMFIGGLTRTRNLYGWYRGDKFRDWIGSLIADKTGNADITLAELHAQGFKDLYVTATCLNRQQLMVLSRENYPHMKVRDAVRISMSIPLYFAAVLVDSTGMVYKKPGKTKGLDVMVDGGITGNFPIFMFDTPAQDAANNKQRTPDPHTLGIRIDEELQIRADAGSRQLRPLPISNLQDYLSALYTFTLENLNRHELTEADWLRTVSISSAGIGPRIRRLSPQEKENLVNSGRTFTARYLEAHCPGSNNADH